jgi:hypothetical protein
MSSSNVTVVVGTLDLYAAAWPVLCHSIDRYWPDCPWPVRFITNNLKAPCGKTIGVDGDHTNWGKRMRKGLNRVESPVILWMTEDNWLTGPVDTNALKDFVGHVLVRGIHHIRLYPGWDHDRAECEFPRDNRLLIFTKDSPYKCSLKPGLWRRATFLELLRDEEEPWGFEVDGSKRSRKFGHTFMAIRDWGTFPFVTRGDPTGPWVKSPVVRGCWTKAAKRYAEIEGLKIDFSKHPVKKVPDELKKEDWLLP